MFCKLRLVCFGGQFMKLEVLAISLSLLVCSSVFAVISEGESAPNFSARAITNNEQTSLSLSSLLARGPVVLYFLASSDSYACNDDLRALANSVTEFSEFHTSVVGIVSASYEEIDSRVLSECDAKLAIVPDPEHSIAKAYDAVTSAANAESGISVVVSPDSEVIHVHASAEVHDLIDQSIEAVQEWSQLVDQEY